MSVTKQEPAMADLRKMGSDHLEALVREALDSETLSEYQCCVLDEFMDREMDRAVDREMDREMDRAVDREAERDLQRWLKWQREVGLHKAFARDYAKHMARISY